jgi:predicted Zn-ribbon and HTH transcriptional regulator
MTRPAAGPPERHETVRAALRHALTERTMTARELSATVGISEKEVAAHLEHLARSVKATGGKFEVEQSRCLDCGFAFKDRARLGRPSRCPHCKGQRVTPPRYTVVPPRSERRQPADRPQN